MTAPPSALAGRIQVDRLDSVLLRGNPLGDPSERELWIYLPPGYDQDPHRRYPVVHVLSGFAGTVPMWGNTVPFGRTFPEQVDGVMAGAPETACIVVFVDGWNRYGGSQYVDSTASGPYHSYLCEEVVAHVDRTYRTLAARDHRAIMGKSSGGFGALVAVMLRPDLFGAAASHAGDALYEHVYLPEFRNALRALRRYGGSTEAWTEGFTTRPGSEPEDLSVLVLLAMAAAFSPDADGRPTLPFDPATGMLRPDVWQRWLDWDPVRMAARHADVWPRLRGLWIDAGTRDEYYLDLGAAALRHSVLKAGLPPEAMRFDLVEGADHDTIRGRMVRSLAWLAGRIAER
ncbi:alpha/beta hydrolase [Streptomyces sp. NBC_01217]|uniref:alpha/beta hydrolase n=1 Tax=Streptomyces sp. NBC_01217 TaxID=2903779 RepID=UPI002E0EBB9E|nr:esterase family protein [Streptomyces sp. NBC_01217]